MTFEGALAMLAALVLTVADRGLPSLPSSRGGNMIAYGLVVLDSHGNNLFLLRITIDEDVVYPLRLALCWTLVSIP